MRAPRVFPSPRTTPTGTGPTKRRSARSTSSTRCSCARTRRSTWSTLPAPGCCRSAGREGANVFNEPGAVRDHNEKFSIAEFPQFTAPSLVSRAWTAAGRSSTSTGDVVLKRLDGMGGDSIFRVRHDDPNRNVIVETISARRAQRHGAALHPRDQGRRQARAADRRQAGAALPRAHSQAGRIARQPRRRRARRGAAGHASATARSPPALGPEPRGARPAPGRAGRDRRLAHRGQRHQPHLLPRDPGPDRLRRVRNVHGRAGAQSSHDRPSHRHPWQHRRARCSRAPSQILGERPAQVAHPQRVAPGRSRRPGAARARADRRSSTPATACWCSPTSSAPRPATWCRGCSQDGSIEGVSGVSLPMLLRVLTGRNGGAPVASRCWCSARCPAAPKAWST